MLPTVDDYIAANTTGRIFPILNDTKNDTETLGLKDIVLKINDYYNDHLTRMCRYFIETYGIVDINNRYLYITRTMFNTFFPRTSDIIFSELTQDDIKIKFESLSFKFNPDCTKILTNEGLSNEYKNQDIIMPIICTDNSDMLHDLNAHLLIKFSEPISPQNFDRINTSMLSATENGTRYTLRDVINRITYNMQNMANTYYNNRILISCHKMLQDIEKLKEENVFLRNRIETLECARNSSDAVEVVKYENTPTQNIRKHVKGALAELNGLLNGIQLLNMHHDLDIM